MKKGQIHRKYDRNIELIEQNKIQVLTEKDYCMDAGIYLQLVIGGFKH